ncbi:MAG: hypothetical protein AABY01_01550 [Nanoarchaeota archaeon]
MNKKAALELSINAIVVLILAITILGLGIGFIRSQFGGLTKQFTQVNAEIQDQLINKIKESGDLLVFDRAELQAGIGKKDAFYIGVKNTASNPENTKDSVCYRLAVKCIRALKPENRCPGEIDNVIVGGKSYTGETPLSSDSTWFQMFDEIDIKNNEVGVFPITVQIAKANPDTYAMEFQVSKSTDSTECAMGAEQTPYQSKQFFIVLS